MKHFFVFTFLFLVIQFERPVFGKNNQEINAVVGKKLDINPTKITGDLVNCQAVFHGSKKDILYKIYPDPDKYISHIGRWDKSCGFSLTEFSAELSGKWTIKTSYKSAEILKDFEETFFVYENQNVKALPATTVYVEEDQYVTLYIEETNISQNSTCILKMVTEEIEYNLKNLPNNSYKIELYGKCGVRMLIVDNKQHGQWSLSSVSDYKKLLAEFNIEVSNKNHHTTQIKEYYEQWNQGTNENLRLLSRSDRIYCEVQRPDGYIIVLNIPDCVYNVDIVSTVHAGVWIARYGLKHSMELVEEHYNIEVWDSQSINVTVINDKTENAINMLCEVGVKALRQCMFIKPDGTIKILPAAVGNNKYEYYGIGYENNANRKAQCGLTIRNPHSNDYGVWKCSVMTDNYKTLTALVNVNLLANQKSFDKRYLKISKEHTYVKYGDNFELKCSVDTQLDYCWMLSPNGTIYSVSKDKNSTNSLQYSGKGLSLGVCGAIVENADETHQGGWSCHLGVSGYSAEITSTIQVTVTDSYLIPSAKNIDGSTQLLCRLFPNTEAEIDYCRWINPYGNGLYQNDLTKYNIKQNKNNCSLQFQYGDIIDIGNWKCYARLTSGSDEEYYADIYYTPSTRSSYLSYRSFTFNFLVLGLLFSFCATTALLFHKTKQFKNMRNQLPLKLPTSYSQSYNLSEKNNPEKKNIES